MEINSSSDVLYKLLKSMDGTHSIQELLRIYKFISAKKLSSLIKKLVKTKTVSLLKTSWNNIQNDRFNSELIYYYSEGFNGDVIQNLLHKQKIVIFGSGGGGSLLALQLVNLGVENIHLVDNDVITEANLNRQFLFEKEDVGKLKVDVLKERLLKKSPTINVTTSQHKIVNVQNALDEITNQTWCFCCIDEPPYIAQRIINRAAYIKKIPSLYGFSARDSAKMVMVNPKVTGCIDCLLTERDNRDFQQLISAFRQFSFTLTTPIIISTMMLEVSWIMKKWLDVIVRRKKIESTLFRFDYNKMEEEDFVKFEKNCMCPTCGRERNESNLWKIIPIN